MRSKKSNVRHIRIPFRVSRVSGAQLVSGWAGCHEWAGFATGLTHQGCSSGESLATYGRFNRLGIWTPYLPHQKQMPYH